MAAVQLKLRIWINPLRGRVSNFAMGGLVMDVNARFKMSENYFHSYWDDWVVTRGRWKKLIGFYSALFFIVFGGAGLVFLFFFPKAVGFGPFLMLLICGIGLLVWDFLWKRIWMRQMLKDTTQVNVHSLLFSPDIIHIKGPHAETHAAWDMIKGVTIAPNGLFLRLSRGLFIYIPDTAFEVEDGKNTVIQMYHDAQDKN